MKQLFVHSNTGAAFSATGAVGDVIMRNAETEAIHNWNTTAFPASFYFEQIVPVGEMPRRSQVFKKADAIKSYGVAYSAGTKNKFVLSSFTNGAGNRKLRIIDKTNGIIPDKMESYILTVAGSETDDAIIESFVRMMNVGREDKTYNVKDDSAFTVTLAATWATADTVTITIDGVTYTSATAGTQTPAATATVWHTAHAANVLAVHGITVTDDTAGVLTFKRATYGRIEDNTISSSEVTAGNGTATTSSLVAATTLTIEAKEVGTVLELDDVLVATATITTTAYAPATGTKAQVLVLEEQIQDVALGQRNKIYLPQVPTKYGALAAVGYDMISVTFKSDVPAGQPGDKFNEVFLALNTDYAYTLANFTTYLGV